MVQAASTTSLIDPPSRFRIALSSDSGRLTTANRLVEPIGTFKRGVRCAYHLVANYELGDRARPLQHLARMQRRVDPRAGDACTGVRDVRDRLWRAGHQRAQERVIA